jgi:hypothetical protein
VRADRKHQSSGVFVASGKRLLMSKQATAMRANVTTELPKSPQFRQFQTRHQAFFLWTNSDTGNRPKKEQSNRSICLDNAI